MAAPVQNSRLRDIARARSRHWAAIRERGFKASQGVQWLAPMVNGYEIVTAVVECLLRGDRLPRLITLQGRKVRAPPI